MKLWLGINWFEFIYNIVDNILGDQINKCQNYQSNE